MAALEPLRDDARPTATLRLAIKLGRRLRDVDRLEVAVLEVRSQVCLGVFIDADGSAPIKVFLAWGFPCMLHLLLGITLLLVQWRQLIVAFRADRQTLSPFLRVHVAIFGSFLLIKEAGDILDEEVVDVVVIVVDLPDVG